jgi:hypothetical protein
LGKASEYLGFVLFVLRAVLARFIFKPAEFGLCDTALASMLAPRGWLLLCLQQFRCGVA